MSLITDANNFAQYSEPEVELKQIYTKPKLPVRGQMPTLKATI
jgi:hypothetical protein